MTLDTPYFLGLFGCGALVAAAVGRLRLSSPPRSLVRVNYRGREVPAVLGDALVIAAITGIGVVAVVGAGEWRTGPEKRVVLATLLLLVVFGIAGAWDDRKGDERPRGFGGHLRALRGGRVTGGLVKLVAGGLAGLAAGALVFDDLGAVVQTGLIVALTANLVNLFDRAPGRAAKVTLLLAAPLVIWGGGDWALASGAALGALAALLPLDLAERGMLGDAGANPIGAVVGFGAALSCGPGLRWVLVVVLLGLNAASERWSFSRAIEAVPALRAFDRAGRLRDGVTREKNRF